jgi:hypothetical protein
LKFSACAASILEFASSAYLHMPTLIVPVDPRAYKVAMAEVESDTVILVKVRTRVRTGVSNQLQRLLRSGCGVLFAPLIGSKVQIPP